MWTTRPWVVSNARRHGSPDDIRNLQTGPIGDALTPDAERGDPTILSWVPLEVDVNELGILNVNFKNQPLGKTSIQVSFQVCDRPHGHLRCQQVHHIDNLTLKTRQTNLSSRASSLQLTAYYLQGCG